MKREMVPMPGRWLSLALVFVLLASMVVLTAPAPATAAGKKILVLYKQRDPNHEGLVARYTDYLRQAGFEFEAKDVETYFPADPDTSAFGGIVTCYESNNMVGADQYPLWLDKQMDAGKKVVVIGMYGAFQGLLPRPDKTFVEWNESSRTINTFFWPFGLEFYPAFSNTKGTFTITRKEKQFAEFEAPLVEADVEKTGYQLFRSVNPQNKLMLTVQRSDLRESESAFIVQTPYGGMILQGYTPYWDGNRVDKRTGKKGTVVQRTDMVAFLRQCLEGTAPPVAHYDLKTHDELLKANPLPVRPPPPDPYVRRPGEVKRRVLVIYKQKEMLLTNRHLGALSLEHHPFYNRADVVLASLGVGCDYHAVEEGLPDDARMERYIGIITWFGTPYMAKAQRYNDWLLHQIQKGRKVVILQDYGATVDAQLRTPATNVAKVFEALGLEYGNLTLSRFEKFPTVRVLDKEMLGFEHPLDPKEITYGHRYVSRNPANKVYLSLEDAYSGPIDLVVTTPHGGVALEDSAFYFPPGDRQRIALIYQALRGELLPEKAEDPTLGAWILNPYLFLSRALDLEDKPSADYTSMNGARIFYSHIDGDGLDSLSYTDGTFWAGRYIFNEVLKRYKNVPTSVSVISRFVEQAGNRYYHPSVEMAREMYREPNIQPASHASTHPFDWVEGDPYVSNPESYPWQIKYQQQNFVDEIWGSKLFIDQNLAPKDKPMEVIFWTGATNPDARALEVCWRAGVHNLNGGDPVFDTEHPTLAGLCPVATPFGPYRQFHTSARNDYIYMLFLLGDWDGQKKVLDHYERTESPRRILPMNLYYHFYSGLKYDSINALKQVIEGVIKMEPAMMFAHQYCEIAEDFYRTSIWQDGTAWRVKNQGDLRQVRFRGTKHVDVVQSRGVVGYMHHQGETYVHLDGRPERSIVLSGGASTAPSVERCTFFIDKGRATHSSLDLEARGFGLFKTTFRGLGTAQWQVRVTNAAGQAVMDKALLPDSEGKATVQVEVPAPQSQYKVVVSRS